MLLTENQLFDYIYCPVKYHTKHVLKIGVQDEGKIHKLLRSVANYFLLNLKNGVVPTLKQVQRKWDSICEANQEWMTTDQCIKGWAKILNFIKWAEKERIIVGEVMLPYSIIVDGHMLEGTIDSILVTPQKNIEILDVNFSEKLPDKVDIDMKMKYSLNIEGFKNVYDSYPSVQKIYLAKHNQSMTTTRNEQDLSRIRSTIKNVCKSIESGIYYPRESVLCKGCTCREYCRYWHD